jgi:hypothetical protein
MTSYLTCCFVSKALAGRRPWTWSRCVNWSVDVRQIGRTTSGFFRSQRRSLISRTCLHAWRVCGRDMAVTVAAAAPALAVAAEAMAVAQQVGLLAKAAAGHDGRPIVDAGASRLRCQGGCRPAVGSGSSQLRELLECPLCSGRGGKESAGIVGMRYRVVVVRKNERRRQSGGSHRLGVVPRVREVLAQVCGPF